MNKKIISKLVSGTLLCSMIGYTIPVFAYTKDETVYSKLDVSGNNYKTIVSTHIENTNNEELIKDLSDLLDIENTSGEETYTQDGNTFIWNSNKNDIYYQGKTTKDLPISCDIKYELNGKEVSADEIVGKSGNVKINLQYTNKEERVVDINGRKVKMYIPFVVVTGTIINNENASNIKVSSGKVVDDGTKSVVVGMAMPGLQESLGLSDDDVKIPSNIEITMDTESFKSESIVSCVTPKVIDKEDLSIFGKLDDVYGKVDTLQSSSRQIEEGANKLKDGTQEYSQKSKEFNSAMNQVSDGVSNANENYSKIDSGISSLNTGSSTLVNGAQQLNLGIDELSTKLSALPESVSQLYQGSVALNSGINGENGLKNGVDSLESSLSTTIQTLNSNINTLTNTVSQLLEAGYTESDTIIVNLQKQISTDTIVLKQLTSKETQSNLSALNSGISSISKGTQNLERGLSELDSATRQLPSALSQLTTGSKSLVNGSKTLKTGVSTLTKGSNTLKSGMQTLNVSTKELTSANNQLTDGASNISNGADTLFNGIHSFNKEGIEKICDYINGDIKNLADRVQVLTDLSKDYNNFTMIDEGNEGNVKFIMIVDAVKKQNDRELVKEEAIVDK